jgi:diacylglycerol kinase (ATP)
MWRMSEDTVPGGSGEERSKTHGENWLVHFFKAFSYSMAGIGATFKLEMAFRMELAAFVILTPLALLLPLSLVFKALVLGSMFLVLVAELLNSALEWIVDYISKDHHPYAKRAKDMGSAAVFFALLNAGAMWTFAILDWGILCGCG